MFYLIPTLLSVAAIVILILAIKNANNIMYGIKQIKNKQSYNLIVLNIIAAISLITLISLFSIFSTYDNRYYSYLLASIIFILSSSFIYIASIVTHDMGILLVKLDKARKLDSLTQIYNRKQITKEIKKEFIHFQRYQRPATIAMIDINKFKAINDSFGHQAGDKVILELVKNIVNNCRKTDRYGRFGGDEFIILLPETKLRQAQLLSNRLITTIKDTKLIINTNIVSYNISVGLAEISYKYESYEQWLHAADLELMKLKHELYEHK